MQKNTVLCLTLVWISILAPRAVAAPDRSGPAGADPFSLWDYCVSPGAWGVFPDAMAVGIRAGAPIDALAAFPGAVPAVSYEAAIGLPGLLYRYANDGGSESHELTGAGGLAPYLGFGLRFRWDSRLPAGKPCGYQDLGLVVRPVGFVSTALAMDDVFDAAGDGLGAMNFALAIRPLAFDPRLETLLTISADASYAGGAFSFGSVGARVVLEPWLSVNGWYSPSASTFGAGFSLSLAGSESSAGISSIGTASTSGATAGLGGAFRPGRATRDAGRVFGRSVLVMEDPGIYAETPPLMDLDAGAGWGSDLWYGQALAAVDRAASDPSIAALVMIEPPLFATDARAQEFGRALTRFRDAGKQLYVHARSMDRLSYVYGASGADLVALDPNGMLALLDIAWFSFYFKDLLANLGVEIYNLQSHETKTAYNTYSESGMTDAERTMVTRYVTGLASQAYAALAAARGGKLKGEAAALVGGGPYLDPQTAVDSGLVDSLMYRDEFSDAVDEKTGHAPRIDIRSYARERGLSWGQSLYRSVAVVYLTGSIIEGKGVAGSSIGDTAAEHLKALREDPMTAGVILRVDSGGGSALTSDHIAREVRRLKEAGKPVVVSMAGYAASGGYYISAYADEIFAEAGTITGSIGVTGLDFNAVDLLEKLGIGAEGVSAGASGEFGNMFLPRRERDADILRSFIMRVYGRFLDVVAEGRKMDKARVDELGKGQIWLGSEAVANGLIDRIGGLEDAKAAMEKRLGGKAFYVDCVPGELPMNPFLSALGASLASATGLDAVPAALADALRVARDLAAMGSGPLYLEPTCLAGRR